MSRSYSKVPKFYRRESEKEDKKAWHSNWRAREKKNLKKYWNDDDFQTIGEKDVSNPYWFKKDGLKGIFLTELEDDFEMENIKKWKRK
mgnify:CR=1 FL=1